MVVRGGGDTPQTKFEMNGENEIMVDMSSFMLLSSYFCENISP